jgi:hypothetical protein
MNSPFSPERQAEIKAIKPQTVEEFLAAGGSIDKVNTKQAKEKKVKMNGNTIDAQALLDAAAGTPAEKEVIAFLASQGIEVE